MHFAMQAVFFVMRLLRSIRPLGFISWIALLGSVLLVGAIMSSVQAQDPQDAPAVNQEHSILDDPFVREQGKRGLDSLYNMAFDDAEAAFEQIEARYPDHPVGPFLNGLNVWWRILPDLENTAHDDDFYRYMQATVDRADALLDDTPDHFDATFFKGIALALQARLKSNRGEWISSVRHGRRSIRYVRTAQEKAPHIDDFAFGRGMYDYYAAIIPEEYSAARMVMWMLPDGDREGGLQMIHQAAEEGWYIQSEARYFLTQIYTLYEDDYAEARRHIDWLREAHPHNSYFHAYAGRLHSRQGHLRKARAVFEEVVERHEEGWTGYNIPIAQEAYFHLARERFVRRDYETALQHLARIESLHASDEVEDRQYVALGRLYQGMIYDATDRRDLAVNRYRIVLSMEEHGTTHERAERYLDEPYGS